MFQASINDLVIAEATTREELAGAVAHAADTGRLYDPATGIKVTLNDCDVVEVTAFEAQVKKARQCLGLGAHHSMLYRCNGALPLADLERFCQDGYTDDDDLNELIYAFEQAGATKAATIARQYLGL